MGQPTIKKKVIIFIIFIWVSPETNYFCVPSEIRTPVYKVYLGHKENIYGGVRSDGGREDCQQESYTASHQRGQPELTTVETLGNSIAFIPENVPTLGVMG